MAKEERIEGWEAEVREDIRGGNDDVVSERLHSQQIQSAGCRARPVSAALALTNGIFSEDLIRGKWAFMCSPARSAARTEK